jgi:hypothetical protein
VNSNGFIVGTAAAGTYTNIFVDFQAPNAAGRATTGPFQINVQYQGVVATPSFSTVNAQVNVALSPVSFASEFSDPDFPSASITRDYDLTLRQGNTVYNPSPIGLSFVGGQLAGTPSVANPSLSLQVCATLKSTIARNVAVSSVCNDIVLNIQQKDFFTPTCNSQSASPNLNWETSQTLNIPLNTLCTDQDSASTSLTYAVTGQSPQSGITVGGYMLTGVLTDVDISTGLVLSITATDSDGLTSLPMYLTLVVTKINQPPIFDDACLLLTRSVEETVPISIDINSCATDPEGGAITWKFAGGALQPPFPMGTGITFSNGVFGGAASSVDVGQQQYTLQIQGYDSGNIPALSKVTMTLIVQTKNNCPTVSTDPLTVPPLLVGNVFSWNFGSIFSDADLVNQLANEELTYTLNGLNQASSLAIPVATSPQLVGIVKETDDFVMTISATDTRGCSVQKQVPVKGAYLPTCAPVPSFSITYYEGSTFTLDLQSI